MSDRPDDDREVLAEALCEHDDHPWALLARDEADHYYSQADRTLAVLHELGYAKADGLRALPAEADLPGEARAHEELIANLRSINLTTHLFIGEHGGVDARPATDEEAAEAAAGLVLATFTRLAAMFGYFKPDSKSEEIRLRVAGTD